MIDSISYLNECIITKTEPIQIAFKMPLDEWR